MSELVKASTLIATAIDLWKNGDNWIKGEWRRGEGPNESYCMLGAINKAAAIHKTRKTKHATQFITEAIQEKTNKKRVSIIAYNDSYRKFPEIKDVMCKALNKALDHESKE